MNRRKFLIGAGSLAAGSAAAVGTGAFNFANVERGVNVNIADDANAFLALEDTSDYADGSGNELTLTFDGSSTAGTSSSPGNGINQDSDYSFTGVFSITNQGSQPVGVWINDNDSSSAAEWYGAASDGAPDFSDSIEGSGSPYQLDVGETVYVNVVLLNRDNAASDLPDQINVVADASQG